MSLPKVAINHRVARATHDAEKVLNAAVRGRDRLLKQLGLGGRKANYDDANYEFEGGAQDELRRKHYDKSLRLLWKGEQHASWSSFRDCTKEEKLLMAMAEKAMDAEDVQVRRRINSQEYRDFLKQTYSERERQAIVNVLSIIGHGEAYAWLVSAELLNEVQSTGGRAALTMQVMEEAKHFVVLRELLQAFDVPVPRMNAFEYIWLEWIFKSKGTEKFFGMNVQVETIALSLFGMMSTMPGLDILRLFHRDEARHTALPGNYLKEFPLTWWQKYSPRNQALRLRMIFPALGLLLYVEEDLAELGIDVFEFGGSMMRKLNTLAERTGFLGAIRGEALMPVINEAFNAWCRATRPDFEWKDFTSAETTGGEEELALEREIFRDLGMAVA
jgi:hypothetical protein